MSKGAVVITGASRGIGAATAILAARDAYPVCVNFLRNEDAAQAVVRQIEELGGRAIAVQADVADPDDVAAMFDKATANLGAVTGLVNNAGILEKQTDFAGISRERLDRILRTNVVGSFLCAKEAIARMAKSAGGAGGAIVNVSSCAAKTGSPNEYIDYAMSKGAVDTMTIGLAREVAHDGIRVNAVRPGFIHTEMHADGGEPDRVDRLKSSIPLQRGGEPDEVARAIAWLLSDKASYCTGAFINIAGGIG